MGGTAESVDNSESGNGHASLRFGRRRRRLGSTGLWRRNRTIAADHECRHFLGTVAGIGLGQTAGLLLGGGAAIAEPAEHLAVSVRKLLAAWIERLLLGGRGLARDDRRRPIGRRTAEDGLVSLSQAVAEADGDDDGTGDAHRPADAPRLFDFVSAGLFLAIGRLKCAAVLLLVVGLPAAAVALLKRRIAVVGGGHGPVRLLQRISAGVIAVGGERRVGREVAAEILLVAVVRRLCGRRPLIVAGLRRARRILRRALLRRLRRHLPVSAGGMDWIAIGRRRHLGALLRHLRALLRIGRWLRARVIVEVVCRLGIARAVEAAQRLTVCRGSRSLRGILGRLRLLRIMVGRRLTLLRLAVALLRIGSVLLRLGRRRVLGRLRLLLRGASARARVGLARRMALWLPSTIRGTLGARHLGNPSKRCFSRERRIGVYRIESGASTPRTESPEDITCWTAAISASRAAVITPSSA